MNTSRYAKSAQLTWSSGSGRVVTYLAIRILPLGESVAGTTVAQASGTQSTSIAAGKVASVTVTSKIYCSCLREGKGING